LITKISAARKDAPRKDRSHCLCTLANKTKGICRLNRRRSGIIWKKRMATTKIEITYTNFILGSKLCIGE
jgi:hypothetical protein